MSDREDTPKWIDLKEFVDKGYLQEANRLFFHPLGLSLAVAVDDVGVGVTFHGFMDCRDDPDGVLFGPSFTPDQALQREEKVNFIKAEMEKRAQHRIEKYGSAVQPPESLQRLIRAETGH